MEDYIQDLIDPVETLNNLVEQYKTLVIEYSALSNNETSELNTLAIDVKLNEITTNKETINTLINESPLLKCISNILKYNL